MRVSLSLSIDGTWFDFNVTSATAAKSYLADRLRANADQLEKTNDDRCLVEIRDDDTDLLLGRLLLNVREGESP